MQRLNERYHAKQGFDYYKKGQYALSIEAFTEAIKTDKNARLYCSRGASYSAQKKYELALADYTQAIALEPTLVAAYINRGHVYTEMGHYGLAILDLEHALKLKPQRANTYGHLGYTYYKSNNAEQALFYYNKAMEINPNCKVYRRRAQVQPNLAEAILDYLKAIDLDPKNKEFINEFKNFLAGQHVVKIYQAILTKSNVTQINLIKQCLNPKTLLGKRFYGENFTADHFDYLDMLAQRLDQLEPYLTVVSVTTASIFQPRENKRYVKAKNADAPYIQYIESDVPKSDKSDSDASESEEYIPKTAIAFYHNL